jgi:chemotaxis protein CheZ
MSSGFAGLQAEYGACVQALSEALRSADESAFFNAVDHIVHMREPLMFSELRKLTGDLQKALERFSIESRLADLAENGIPNAHASLAHVIRMTDEAAHHTLDLVEEAAPLAERTAHEAAALMESVAECRASTAGAQGLEGAVRSVEALLPIVKSIEHFLPTVRADNEVIQRNLADVLLTQTYQDLTAQIIRSVMKLVGELESALTNLARLSGGVVEHASLGGGTEAVGGPAVPGVTQGEVATGQTDVDALLSGLGM